MKTVYYLIRQRYEEAEAACRKAIELQKRATVGDNELRTLGAYMRLGYAYYRQGRYEEALQAYDRERAYLSSHRDHALRTRTMIELKQKLGAALLRAGRTEEARQTLDQAIESYEERRAAGSDESATQYYIACAHALRGDAEQAVHYFAASSENLGAYNRWRGATEPDLEAIRGELETKGLIDPARSS